MGQPSSRKAAAVLTLLALAVAVITIIAYARWSSTSTGDRSDAAVSLTAWIADWEWEAGIEDFRIVAPALDRVQMFGVSFDENDRLHVTEPFDVMLAAAQDAAERDGGGRVRIDLTVVNDVVRADGTSAQKDPALLARWMATEERRAALIERIAALAEERGADGVEIDFENVRDADWERVILFYKELHRRLQASGLGLRVVLEPRAPIEVYAWPDGPEYVMMAYNLYGPHSGPGPKADDSLIRRVTERLARLPGSGTLALAAGGFDWSEAGGVSAVTERRALELARVGGNGEGLTRDGASGGVHFEYVDEEGRRHTVWFADRATLERWIGIAREAGVNRIAVWKLGGFERATLEGLRDAASGE